MADEPWDWRALTHPVRLALLGALITRGPLTATEAARWIRSDATTCSFHFRQLARYGFVEPAAASNARDRPWRLTRRTAKGLHECPDCGATHIRRRRA